MGAYNDDVLFLHIPKCGGWAVKTYLREHLPGVLMPDDPAAKLPIGHVRLQDIERFTGRAPDSWKRIVAVVRNPYEQQLSQFTFWATRYAKGGRHIHDIVTGAYVYWPAILQQWPDQEDMTRHKETGWGQYVWTPEQINLEGWLQVPRSDFHVWYLQHHAYQPGMTEAEQQQLRRIDIENQPGANQYTDFGGLFRFWLTVDGEIPDNVCVLRQESLGEELRNAIAPFADHELPELPRKNTSSHPRPTHEYYTPLAARLVEEKCQWAFANYYQRWMYSDFAA